MGGPAINKDKLRDNILVQNKPYTPDAIAMSANVSRSAAYMVIKELIGEGKVILDSKDGHKMFYATVSAGRPPAGISTQAERESRKGTARNRYTVSFFIEVYLPGKALSYVCLCAAPRS